MTEIDTRPASGNSLGVIKTAGAATAAGTLRASPAAEQLLADLAVVVEWKEDLTCRLARGQFILETIGLSAERHDELIAEARAFNRVCDALAQRIPGSLVPVDDDRLERRAA